MAVRVTSTGGTKAAARVRSIAAGMAGSALKVSVDQTAAATAARAVDFTADRYNVSKDLLSKYIYVRRASIAKAGARGSVDLQIKALPIEVFGPQVVMREFIVRGRTGARWRRKLPTIEVALFTGQPQRRLGKYFPKFSRNNGSLSASDGVLRRIGAGRGERRDGTVGNRLTGVRFVTFPSKFLRDRLAPELQRFAGETLRVHIRAAYRNQRGQLRQNN